MQLIRAIVIDISGFYKKKVIYTNLRNKEVRSDYVVSLYVPGNNNFLPTNNNHLNGLQMIKIPARDFKNPLSKTSEPITK